MNAYWIESCPMPYYEPVHYGGDYLGSVREDDVIEAAIVIAETRGQAKSLFFAYAHKNNNLIEWTDIATVRILTHEASDYEPGIIDDCPEIPHQHPLWKIVSERFWPDYDPTYIETLYEEESVS